MRLVYCRADAAADAAAEELSAQLGGVDVTSATDAMDQIALNGVSHARNINNTCSINILFHGTGV